MSKENPFNQDAITGEAGSHPLGTGVGAGSGALAGAAIGAVGGPLGSLAGAAVGAIAGGLAGKEVAEGYNPTVGGDPEQNVVGEGVGASAGVLAGGTLGAIGGPLGMAVGAALGAVGGGIVGAKIEEQVSEDDSDRYNTTHINNATNSENAYIDNRLNHMSSYKRDNSTINDLSNELTSTTGSNLSTEKNYQDNSLHHADILTPDNSSDKDNAYLNTTAYNNEPLSNNMKGLDTNRSVSHNIKTVEELEREQKPIKDIDDHNIINPT